MCSLPPMTRKTSKTYARGRTMSLSYVVPCARFAVARRVRGGFAFVKLDQRHLTAEFLLIRRLGRRYWTLSMSAICDIHAYVCTFRAIHETTLWLRE